MTPDEILTWVEGQMWSKRQWLESHGSKWPIHDVEMKQRDLEFLEQIARHYQIWIEHKRQKEKAA